MIIALTITSIFLLAHSWKTSRSLNQLWEQHTHTDETIEKNYVYWRDKYYEERSRLSRLFMHLQIEEVKVHEHVLLKPKQEATK